MTPEQRASLLAVKLAALVSTGWQPDPSGLVASPFQAGSALVDPVTHTGWCLVAESQRDRDPIDGAASGDGVDDPNPRGWIGGCVVWATRNDVELLHVVVDRGDPGDARRLALLRPSGRGELAAPRLWHAVGRAIVEARLLPFVARPEPVDAIARYASVIREAGADPVVEHGVLRAEYLGLEIGRAVHDDDGSLRFAVGVGRHDRLANQMLGQDRDLLDALSGAREAVASFRRPGAGTHPANQLAVARWLRAAIVGDPSIAGVDGPLVPVEGTEPAGLRRPTPAIALGDGVVVACSVGIDLDAPVFGADARAAYASDARLVVVVPERNAVSSLRLVCACIADCELRSIDTALGR